MIDFTAFLSMVPATHSSSLGPREQLIILLYAKGKKERMHTHTLTHGCTVLSSRSVEGLKTRIAQLETVESKLLSSQAEVRHLQHQLRMYRQDTHFVEGVQQQLMDYESLQHQFRSLMEEKNSLAQDRANSDLLRYQVQSLQHRCEELEGVMEEVAKLQVENTRLQLKEGNGKDTSTSVLQAQLVELQQREIVSLHKHGELTTQ